MSYTPEQEQAVREAAPLDLAKAKEVAAVIGVSYRSVIAKAKQLGLEYIPKPAPAKSTKVKPPTKAELVAAIRESTGLPFVGLEKASVSAIFDVVRLTDAGVWGAQVVEAD